MSNTTEKHAGTKRPSRADVAGRQLAGGFSHSVATGNQGSLLDYNRGMDFSLQLGKNNDKIFLD